MIKNGMWDVFYFPDPQNQEKNCDLFLNQSIFTLDYVKLYIKDINRGSKEDKYMVQNLTWSGAYLWRIVSYAILRKVLKLVPLTVTGPKLYITTITTVISNSYDSLEETLNHLKCLKLKYCLGENVAE